MNKKIDSTLYFFQFLIARIIVIGGIGFLIYSLITKEIGAIIFCTLFLIMGVFILKKQVPKPTDLSFDQDSLYLDNLSHPIKIADIESLENGVIKYNSNGETNKFSLPNFYYIDKNYTKLKKTIENKSTKTQQCV
ncbi:hypothetical protein [Winogradskyella ursingii]|uniref:hypothetical protein n=1 Tax=Winogradskyella ursingii TaxID=2686079 RepID=UPI0015C7D47F|nr:hypothetical protein [Winogradskyella ursingii]